jgi:hypothetical protein
MTLYQVGISTKQLMCGQQMTNQEGFIAEYSALRQEISQVLQKQVQFVGAALAVASAFIVYGFQAQNSLAFLAASIILLSAIYMSAKSAKHISSVATYLYAIVEPKVEGLQWETMLVESRKMGFPFTLKFSKQISICVYALLNIGCVFFAWLFIRDYRILNVLLYSSITVILVVNFILISLYSFCISSDKYRSNCVSRWKKIEEEINPIVVAIHSHS